MFLDSSPHFQDDADASGFCLSVFHLNYATT